MTPLRNDFARDLGLGGLRSGQKFLFVGSHGDYVPKRDLTAHFARQGLNLDGISGRDPVLLSPSSNDGVHRPSRRNSETPIIRTGGLKVNDWFARIANWFRGGRNENLPAQNLGGLYKTITNGAGWFCSGRSVHGERSR